MVTSLDDMDSLANAFVAGANDYITKPLNRIELIARVRAALKLKAELERRQARERELLQFLSNWGDKHASVWIDEATGLFVGEVAEAYLTAVTERHPDELMSVLALAVDRLDVIRSAQGEAVGRQILAQVAHAVRRTAASIGVVAASYRNGMITVMAPELGAVPARRSRRSLAQGGRKARPRQFRIDRRRPCHRKRGGRDRPCAQRHRSRRTADSGDRECASGGGQGRQSRRRGQG